MAKPKPFSISVLEDGWSPAAFAAGNWPDSGVELDENQSLPGVVLMQMEQNNSNRLVGNGRAVRPCGADRAASGW
jgi:hypothetical protein